MPVRHLLAALSGALAPPAAWHVAVQPDPVGALALTSGRLWASLAALLALAGVVAGGLALARSGGGGGRRPAIAALAGALAGVVIGGWVVAAAEGGPGTGYGIVGGFVALAAGPVALLLGGAALARSRRSPARRPG